MGEKMCSITSVLRSTGRGPCGNRGNKQLTECADEHHVIWQNTTRMVCKVVSPIVYDFNVWIQQKSTLPKSQSPIQGTTKYERLSKYKKKINPSLRCKPGPAIIRVKFPDLKKGICQKLNQSQKTRQLQPLIKSIPPHLQGSSPLSHRFMVNVCEGSHRPHSRRKHLESWPHPHPPGPAIIRVKFPDYKKGICQKLNQSQKARQLQLKVLNWTWEISFTLAAWSATNTVKDNFIKYYFICLTYRRSIYCLSNFNLSWTLPPTPTPPHGLSSAKQKI